MSRRCSIFVVLVLALVVAFPAFAIANRVTVGDFLVRVAAARDLPAADASQAVRSLRATGIGVPALDLSAPLTQGVVVQVSGVFGLSLRSSSPNSEFSAEQLERYFVTFEDEIGDGDLPTDDSGESAEEPGPYPRPNENAADPLTKGKGKKKGLPVSPSEPI
jgi:hypothetical protein